MRSLVLLLLLIIGHGKCLQMETFFKYLNISATASSECSDQMEVFTNALLEGEPWALKMLDAFGRVPLAITQGNRADMGMFEQCVDTFEKLETGDLKGRYCYSGLIVPLLSSNTKTIHPEEFLKKHLSRLVQSDVISRIDESDAESSVDYLSIATCLPDACYPSDVFGDVLGRNEICQVKGDSRIMRPSDIVCLVFLGAVILIVVVSSVYDFYLEKTKKAPPHEVLLAFSAYTNGKKILKTTSHAGQIKFFNGMKVLSMCWVILGHRFSIISEISVNLEEIQDFRKAWYSFYILLAHLAVDTFFFISGALMTYGFLKTMRKPGQKFNVFLFYLHRYIRLTPALAVVYFFQVTIARRIATGPLSIYLANVATDACYDQWWSFFFYFQNYAKDGDKLCLTHTWYLSVDMHFFIISPLILLPMVRYGKKISYVLVPILVLITTGYIMVIFYVYDLRIWSDDYYNMYYYATHGRFPPWLIGIVFGAFILDYQQNPKKFKIKRQSLVIVAWVAVLAVMAFILLYQNDADHNHTRLKATLYFPLQRTVWALCLCWISYACMAGYGFFVDTILSLDTFQILSKVTYSTYLIQSTTIAVHVVFMRAHPILDTFDTFRNSLCDILVDYGVGFLWTLAFESPIMILEKFIFGQGGQKAKRDKGGDKSDKNQGNPEVQKHIA